MGAWNKRSCYSKKTFRSIALLLTIYIILAASEDGIRADVGKTAGSQASESSSANRGLPGYLAFVWRGRLWKTDLSSGEISKFKRDRFENDPSFANIARFRVVPIGAREKGFLLGVADCYYDGFQHFACVEWLDKDALRVDGPYYFKYGIDVAEDNVAVSVDGSLFAVISDGLLYRTLSIYRRNGDLVGRDELYLSDPTNLSLAWGADGILYYTHKGERKARIYYWDPKEESTSGHMDLEYDGYIAAIRASPTENKIAFELVNSESSVYVADLDEGKAYRLVQSDGSYDNQFFTSPVWSPDGKWMLVQHHNPAAQPGLTPYQLIALPSDSVGLVYDLDNSSPDAIPFRIEDNSEDVLLPSAQAAWFRGGAVYWIAD